MGNREPSEMKKALGVLVGSFFAILGGIRGGLMIVASLAVVGALAIKGLGIFGVGFPRLVSVGISWQDLALASGAIWLMNGGKVK
jgi:hypothetical protein